MNFGTGKLNYIDISPVVSARTAVFPGDESFSRKVSMSYQAGHHLELSSITTTLHIGAHADAPSHYHRQGDGIDLRPLDYYFGPAQVIRVNLSRGERILPKHIQHDTIHAPRVLLATGSYPNPDQWNSDFNSLSPELIEFLHQAGVFTVGIDTPSVDPADSKILEAHSAIAEKNMAILEGIVLEEAPVGIYTLVALPLRLEGCEASPVRAILLP